MGIEHEVPKTVAVVGVPYSYGQPRGGVEDGPKAMRDHGLNDKIKDLGFQVTDLGDVMYEETEDVLPDVISKNEQKVSQVNKMLTEKIKDSINEHDITVLLGGDHSFAIGSIIGHAMANPDICVLWIDAHADLNTPSSSDTQNMHGMPVAFVLHEMQQFMPENKVFDWCKPCMSCKNIAYIGLRDVDSAEKYFIESLGIRAYSMTDVDQLGIVEVVKRSLAAINPDGKRKIQVQFDIDGTDPELVAPATGTPVEGGLSLRESLHIMEAVAQTGNLQIIKMAEVNPHLGNESEVKKTVSNAIKIICAALGQTRGGHYPPGFKTPNVLKPEASA